MTTSRKSRRGWGEGRVEHGKFAQGSYRVQVSLGLKADGKRDRRYVYGATKDEALDRAADLRRRRRAGMPMEQDEPLGVYLTRWLARHARQVEPRTIETYEQMVRAYVIPTLGDRPFNRVTPGDIDDLMQRLVDRGHTARMANKVRNVLSAAYTSAIRYEGATFNPVSSVPQRSHRARVATTLRNDQLPRLIAAAGDIAPYIVVAAGTGLRQGELLALTWGDIEGDVIHVRRSLVLRHGYYMKVPKTASSERRVTVGAAVVNALQQQRDRQRIQRTVAEAAERWVEGEWPDGKDYDLVFRNPSGTPIDGRILTKKWYRLIDRVNAAAKEADEQAELIPRVTWHGLRHTFATVLIEQGVSLPIVSELLGHRSLNTTAKIYGHPGDDVKRAAVGKLDRLLG